MPEVLSLTLSSPATTHAFGERVGACCVGGEVFLLNGTLGAGKTCFVQGMAVGLAVPGGYVVCSPTYILHAQYPGRLELNHLDLYRLADSPAARQIDLGFEEFIAAPQTVTAIEWAEHLAHPPSADCITISLSIIDETTRACRLEFFGAAAENISHALKDAPSDC